MKIKNIALKYCKLHMPIIAIIFTMLTSAGFAYDPDDNGNSPERIRARMILSKSIDASPSSFKMGYYDKRTGKLGIIDNPALVFSINQPRNDQDEIIFECGQYKVCCVDWELSGCGDFVLECAEIGCKPTPYNGGQHGICDCSP